MPRYPTVAAAQLGAPEAEARVEFLVDGQIEEGIERILGRRRRGDRLRRPWKEAGRACRES